MPDAKDKVIVNTYLPIIKRFFPDCSTEDITVFREGYDHDVLVLQNQKAFRFPRTKIQAKLDQVENVFFPEFIKSSPIPVPNITGHIDPATGLQFQRYRFIPGVQLTKDLAATLPEHALATIAADMSKFLTYLHAFPISKARSRYMEELNPKTYWRYFEDQLIKMKLAMFPLLSKNEQRWIEKLYRDYIGICTNNPFDATVTHSDLLGEHIIIDKKNMLSTESLIFRSASQILLSTSHFLTTTVPYS